MLGSRCPEVEVENRRGGVKEDSTNAKRKREWARGKLLWGGGTRKGGDKKK